MKNFTKLDNGMLEALVGAGNLFNKIAIIEARYAKGNDIIIYGKITPFMCDAIPVLVSLPVEGTGEVVYIMPYELKEKMSAEIRVSGSKTNTELVNLMSILPYSKVNKLMYSFIDVDTDIQIAKEGIAEFADVIFGNAKLDGIVVKADEIKICNYNDETNTHTDEVYGKGSL